MDHAEVEQYNYRHFTEGADFDGFRTVLPVGSPAPDFTAHDLESGRPVALSELWRGRDLLVEFGSLT